MVPLSTVANAVGAEGYVSNCLTACAASLQAIGEATELIGLGEAKIMLQQLFGSEFSSKRLDTRRLMGNCFAGNSLDVVSAALLASDRNCNVLSLARNEEGQNAALVIGRFAA